MPLLLWFLLPFGSFFSSALGEVVKGFLKETVELRAPIGPGWPRLIRHLNDARSLVVARRVNGVWAGEGSYRERVENSPAGVLLKDLNYNDNGLYEFPGPDDKRIQLDVFPLFNNDASLPEGETGKLPCYFVTLGNDVKFVQWEKHNQTVLKLNVSDGKVEYGAGYEGRASVPGWRSGDLTLILEKVQQQEDQAEYFCSVLKGTTKEKGNPAAGRLTVQQLISDVTGTPPPAPGEEPNPWKTACYVMIATCAAAFLLLAWVLQSKSSSPKESSPQEHEAAFPLKNGSLHADRAVVV